MSVRKEQVTSRQLVVDKDRWAYLQSLEFRHLGYVRAAEEMGLKMRKAQGLKAEARQVRYVDDGSWDEVAYHEGYIAAIKDYAEMQLRMIEQVIDAHPEHDKDPGPIRKGQLCLYRQQGCFCLVLAREETE